MIKINEVKIQQNMARCFDFTIEYLENHEF